MRLSKANLQKTKQKIQNYQIEKYPELSKSIVNHEKTCLPTGTKAHALSDKEYQYKLRTGRASDKEQIIGILKTCYKKSNSKETFFELLNECGLTTYVRGGRISGIVFKNKKFRLNRLGFSNEVLQELDKSLNREKNLGEIRNKQKLKNIERGRVY